MSLLLRRSLVGLGCFALMAAMIAAAQQAEVRRFTSLEHLDNDTVKLSGSGELLTFLATWIEPSLSRYQRVGSGQEAYIRTVDGERVTKYPEKMMLRVTMGNKTLLQERKPLELDTDMSADELARNVHFRLRIYNGLESRILEPMRARMIGVPKDIPYNERIYVVEFRLKSVPVEDRLVLEVLDRRDQRVAKFGISML